MTSSTTTATTTLVYRGVSYRKGEVDHASAASGQDARLLTYRGVSYATGAAAFRIKAKPVSRPLGRMIELQFLGNPYQRAW